MKGFPIAKHNKLRHERRIRMLRSKGWTTLGGYWISPYSGVRFTESTAISVEELRGTFRQDLYRSFV